MTDKKLLKIRKIINAQRSSGNDRPTVHVSLDHLDGLVRRGEEAQNEMELDLGSTKTIEFNMQTNLVGIAGRERRQCAGRLDVDCTRCWVTGARAAVEE